MNKTQMWTAAIILIVAITLGAAWALVSMLPDAVLKAALIVALGAVPVVFWAGWRMGSRDAKMFVAGLNKGTGTVINAGGKVADLRTAKATEARQATTPDVRLPHATKLEIVNVQPAGNGEAVEL